MLCRNKQRGETAKAAIEQSTGSSKLELMIADVSLQSDVRRVATEFAAKEGSLDGLVCNAGALLHERTHTAEGLETTMAAHLVVGTYLLTELMLPALQKATEPRVVVVSSGGMYNTKWPGVGKALKAAADAKYSGQLQYAFAKRGQVLLCERWASIHADTGVKFVSCHPGWVATPGVDAAYGSKQSWLEPLRTMWQGAEGLCWLCVAPSAELESGEFYLDRETQPKHVSGTFRKETSVTQNTPAEVDALIEALAELTTSRL